jgi:hypothetical protein
MEDLGVYYEFWFILRPLCRYIVWPISMARFGILYEKNLATLVSKPKTRAFM